MRATHKCLAFCNFCENFGQCPSPSQITPHLLCLRNARAFPLLHFCPQHWLLCDLGLYSLEFEFECLVVVGCLFLRSCWGPFKGRSLERHLKYFGLVDDGGKVISFSEWATAAPVRHQGHARGEAEVFLARRAQETKQRRALFNAETDAEEI